MDPPTAYIFPNAYDKVLLVKGPQTVTEGMGLVGGSVRFVRKEPDFQDKTGEFQTAYTAGGFGRHDLMIDAGLGNDKVYGRLNATYNKSDDYRDGDGNKVHSRFERNSQMLQLGITPTAETLLSATYERSRAKAAYADRMMDGSKFDRDAWNIRGQHRNINEWFSEAEFHYGQSKVDHIMDNFNLRPVKSEAMKRLNNPKRETSTAQLKTTFEFGKLRLQTGADYMRDKHASRSGADYAGKPYTPNQNFKHYGAFAEADWRPSENQNWITGFRHDRVTAVYDPYPASDAAHRQVYALNSGFARWEYQDGARKYYAGFGSAERSPDYWERNRSEDLRPERNNQIDAGVIWQGDNWHSSLSVFGSRINNFILVGGKEGARNISAQRFGGEAEISYEPVKNWRIGSSLAYTYGKNRTDNRPLAQTPPLEWKNTVNWDNGTFSAGALWRVVAKQSRFAKGQGNIAGQDTGKSSGFGVLSLHGGWRISKHAVLQAGVDNVFDKTYAEFVNKNGHPAAGMQNGRINEPGRQLWVRAQAQF